MDWHLGEGARTVLRLWIALAGVAGCLLLGGLAGLLTPWLLLPAGVWGGGTVFFALWYPDRYVREYRGRLDRDAVRAHTGVLWRRQWYIPLSALRTFESWETPLQRRFGCRSLLLHFSGGSILLPLLSAQDSERLTERLADAESRTT